MQRPAGLSASASTVHARMSLSGNPTREYMSIYLSFLLLFLRNDYSITSLITEITDVKLQSGSPSHVEFVKRVEYS